MHISNFDELVHFCGRVRSCDVLAVDTEFLREHTYYPRLCLLQLAAGDDIAAIDTPGIKDLQ